MGNAPSAERSSHFGPPSGEEPSPAAEDPDEQAPPLINISNKMVERLVEDNEIYKETSPKYHKDVYQDKIFVERLRCIDEKHSERIGILREDLEELTNRISLRTAKIAHMEPVCGDCEAQLMDCYTNNEDKTLCGREVDNFKLCVKEQTTLRLKNRIADMEDDHVRKTRDLEKARKFNFWGTLDPNKGKS